MQQSINDGTVVHWSQLSGNKFSKSIHPAMLCKDGYFATSKIALLGTPRQDKQFVTLCYDRDYVTLWLISKLIKPLQNHGLEKILDLVREAWKLIHEPKNRYTRLAVPHDEERE